MADGWFRDIPQQQVDNPARQLGGALAPTAGVLHRTIGRWASDYRIGKTGGAQGFTSFHFLVGHEPGQWVQFAPIDVICNHAAGANGWAFGVEISGQQDEDLTPWQIEAVGRIIAWAQREWGLPTIKYTGTDRISKHTGWIDHRHIAAPPGTAHADGLSNDAWFDVSAYAASINNDQIPTPEPSTVPTQTGPLLRRGATGDDVVRLQNALYIAGHDPGKADGIFGPKTERAVRDFQAQYALLVDGVVGPKTWAALPTV